MLTHYSCTTMQSEWSHPAPEVLMSFLFPAKPFGPREIAVVKMRCRISVPIGLHVQCRETASCSELQHG
ncbi:uncharacterized protein BJ212DRAFT_1363365 [Suillus subaureus]|uniref:Uncharacterized protein n=1 Tax=Suillus subaureus TaxID=48587 RepID=A0A9P7JC22_9AGAM|nr:uncharacterized protein BJ212DRAFT_1363365 [Suillus subaureus]KAG1814365.1 hypothetical protein BJ212DRAFT_1363365 [Suillus subaureus]